MENNNEKVAKQFLVVIAKHYDEYKRKMSKMLESYGDEFDEDVFEDTILKVYDSILRNGLHDTSEQGYLNYFFRSFKINNLAEKKKSYNAKKSSSTDINVIALLDEQNEDEIIKKNELIENIFKTVKEKFGDDYEMFKAKYFHNLTYKQLAKFYGVKDAKRRVCNIKRYIKNNFEKNDSR